MLSLSMPRFISCIRILTNVKNAFLRQVNQQTARPKTAMAMMIWTKKAGKVRRRLITSQWRTGIH